MAQTFLTIGNATISLGEVIAAIGVIVIAALIALAALAARATRERALAAARNELRAAELEERIGELARIQADTAGRIHTMGELLTGRQSELARVLAGRLDMGTTRIGQSREGPRPDRVPTPRQLHQRAGGGGTPRQAPP